MSREEARVWMDLMVVVACMDLKHWKMGKKKTSGRYIGFPLRTPWMFIRWHRLKFARFTQRDWFAPDKVQNLAFEQ